MKKTLLSALAAAALYADTTELEALKNQLSQMEEAIRSMQQKIETLEKASAPAAAPSEGEARSHPLHTADTHGDDALEFGLVIDASYVSRSKKDEIVEHLELPGIAHGLFAPHNHNGAGHPPFNAQNGFNFNYAEMALRSTLSEHLDAQALFHFSENGVGIEEAFFAAHALPYGIDLKGGKFLSDFGYLNGQHHHEWSFSDMPLVYEAFLGNHGINEIGVQLQWTAPTETYLMAGIEALQGKNESMFGHSAVTNPQYDETDPTTGEPFLASSAAQPSLYVGYVKTGFELGSTSLLAGASWAHGNTRIDHFSDEEPYAISGKSDLFGLDLTLEHRFENASHLSWQSEWLYRDMEGVYFENDGTATTPSPIRKKQAGYYTQLLYTPFEAWSIGGRYDHIYRNDVIQNGTDMELPSDMDQYSAMIEFAPSENARYRLQYTHSNAFFNEAMERQNLDSLIMSVTLELGSHGEHHHE